MGKKNKYEEESGISLLDMRLKGKSVDDTLIDDILSNESKNKETENKSNESKIKRFSKKREEKHNEDESTIKSVAEPVIEPIIEPVVEQHIESKIEDNHYNNNNTTAQVEKVDIDDKSLDVETASNAGVYDEVNEESTLDNFSQRNSYDINIVQEIIDTNIDDSTEEDEIIDKVVNSTYSILASDNDTEVKAKKVKKKEIISEDKTEFKLTKEEKAIIKQATRPKRIKNDSFVTRMFKKLAMWGMYAIIIAAFIWVITTYIIGFTTMSGNSMNPTYFDSETLIVDKISINFKNPEIDDVLVFDKESSRYVARVVAISGDKVSIDVNGDILVNGVYIKTADDNNNSLLNEFGEEQNEESSLQAEIVSEVTLIKNQYFVINDNENEIIDSRNPVIGIVNKNDIYGVVLFSVNFNID